MRNNWPETKQPPETATLHSSLRFCLSILSNGFICTFYIQRVNIWELRVPCQCTCNNYLDRIARVAYKKSQNSKSFSIGQASDHTEHSDRQGTQSNVIAQFIKINNQFIHIVFSSNKSLHFREPLTSFSPFCICLTFVVMSPCKRTRIALL